LFIYILIDRNLYAGNDAPKVEIKPDQNVDFYKQFLNFCQKKSICKRTTSLNLVSFESERIIQVNMDKFLALFLVFFLLFLNMAFSQQKVNESRRGTIRVKKLILNKYVISKETTLKKMPEMRTFRTRAYNYNFIEYFPKEYDSKLFPLMFNNIGLYLGNEKKQFANNQIVSYEYEIFKNQVLCSKGVASATSINYPIRVLSKMMTGSCVWIKNLAYKDKDGVVHRDKIGEFKIEKVK